MGNGRSYISITQWQHNRRVIWYDLVAGESTQILRQSDESMNRRQALQLLAGGAVLQLQPVELLAAIRKARSVLGTQPVLRTLDFHRDATVSAIAEMIIPKTKQPGPPI